MIPCINLWNIKPENIHGHEFTGYELLYSEFDRFTKEVYEADPEGTIDEVLKLYRTVNLTPIVYYTEQGIVEAITKFRDTSYNNVDVDRIGLGNNKGQTINRFLFPNMMTAEPKGRKNNSLKDRFLDDPKMRRAIKICFEMREGNKLVYPTALRRSLELVTGENIQNFKPLNAKAIVEHICPATVG